MNTRNIKEFSQISMVIALMMVIFSKAAISQESKSGYSMTAVSFTDVTLKDNFWSKRIETNRTVTIPFGFKKCEDEGRIRNFERAGGLLGGKYEGKMPFDDSDVYKIIEGASYSLAVHPDKELENYIDEI
ncbi:MAG: beta-L-arabinofuranosidase domain-containing protein, partial [Phycisphaerae bacterium]